ncbi:MAG: hypothetical protein KU28_00675 [Sulfurovum sp. PC08-66]|nr:MAG: hypothetical protein KU28_00675 [Sulfurovum sp. PC08-66]KIM12482.1 MAG: hypothetical protein KU37_00790 [Sulfuricurvum sp. PC08-66]
MRKLLFTAALSLLAFGQEESFWHFSGEWKSYNLNNIKTGSVTADTWDLATGGQLIAQSPKTSPWQVKVNLMTANALFPSSDMSHYDGSLVARDDAARTGVATDKATNFGVAGEAYVGYRDSTWDVRLGRQKIATPLAHHKEGARLLPSTFSGATLAYKNEAWGVGTSYLDSFKQRTSSQFINILEHALGTQTAHYTGQTQGDMYIVDAHLSYENIALKAYQYFMPNFISMLYAQGDMRLGDALLQAQVLHENSVGVFDTNLRNGTTIGGKSYTKGVDVLTLAGKATYAITPHTKASLAASANFAFADAYSNVMAFYDGTPLFTDTLTGNVLFSSNYGKALGTTDSSYKAGTLGANATLSHRWDEHLSMQLVYAQYRQNFSIAQHDINAVIDYTLGAWSVAAKAIWVVDNGQVAGDFFAQYRLISVYHF